MLPFIPAYHRQFVVDDPYYYFQIAREFWLTGRFSFDGQALGSGFHPLWMGVCVALYGAVGDALPYAIIGVSLILFSIYFVLAQRLLALFDLAERDRFLFLALLTVNPLLFLNGWNGGLETPLALTFLMAFLRACAKEIVLERGSVGEATLTCCLLFLSRLDAILFAYPLLLFVFRRHLLKRKLLLALPVAVVLGYMAGHYLIFGLPTPASTDAIRFLDFKQSTREHMRWFHTGYFFDFPAHIFQAVRYFVFVLASALGLHWGILGSYLVSKLMLVLILGLIAVEAALTSRRTAKDRSEPGSRDMVERLLTAGASVLLVMGAIYVGILRTMAWREWYFPPLSVVLMFATLLVASRYSRRRRRGAPLLIALSCSAGFSIANALSAPWAPYVPSSRAAVVGPALALAQGGKVAAFNAGVYGWASHGRITNIDGLVNDAAYAAIRDGRFLDYLRQTSIRYILDVDDLDILRRRILDNSGPGAARRFDLQEAAEWPDRTPGFVHRLVRLDYRGRATQ